MQVIDEQFLATPCGGILYDASRIVKPGDELFERDYWSAQHAIEEVSGGRGAVALLRASDERWVLRHYRRGGWIAKFSRDRYLWSGEARTRSFAEWRLLAQLRRRSLPVPAPIGARYVRQGFTYRADLITEYLADASTLADAITDRALAQDMWRAVGGVLAAFHRQGVHHADLNAHNILLSVDGVGRRVYVLDFDRGRIRDRGAWESDVLARLRRSLEKIARQRRGAAFADREWGWLMEGYRRADGG
jgi:3-deoxy-D-manno-octulosonic acid kinase